MGGDSADIFNEGRSGSGSIRNSIRSAAVPSGLTHSLSRLDIRLVHRSFECDVRSSDVSGGEYPPAPQIDRGPTIAHTDIGPARVVSGRLMIECFLLVLDDEPLPLHSPQKRSAQGSERLHRKTRISWIPRSQNSACEAMGDNSSLLRIPRPWSLRALTTARESRDPDKWRFRTPRVEICARYPQVGFVARSCKGAYPCA